jgi:prepilin-type N-terminal cleavage/methylation domain-containing protein
MTGKIQRRRGFTLIELLCVMAVVIVVTATLALLIRETLEAQRLEADGFDRLLQSNALADQFRADVAQAENAPESWKQYVADPETLILQMKNQDHVVYRWRNGKLDRFSFEKGKENERSLPVSSRVAVEFVRAAPNARLLRLRLSTMRDGKVVPGQVLEIAAALGGDWR